MESSKHPANGAATTGSGASSSQQSKARRIELAVRIEAILGHFWRDDTPDAVRVIELEGWLDVLGTCTVKELRTAWARYQRDGPRSDRGSLHRPDAGALWRLVLAGRPRRAPTPPVVEVPREIVTPERAIQIMNEVGYRIRRFDDAAPEKVSGQ